MKYIKEIITISETVTEMDQKDFLIKTEIGIKLRLADELLREKQAAKYKKNNPRQIN